MLNSDHFKETDSVGSLDDLQDVEMFDHKLDMLDNFAMKSNIMRVEMQQEVILANQQASTVFLVCLVKKTRKKGISPLSSLQPLFPTKKAIDVDDDSWEEPNAPKTSALTADTYIHTYIHTYIDFISSRILE